MLDVVVSEAKIEIAIEGPAGVDRDRLWELVQQTATKTINNLNLRTQVTPKVDDAYKRFIWPYLVNEPKLNFLEDTSMELTPIDHADLADDDTISASGTVPTASAEQAIATPSESQPATGEEEPDAQVPVAEPSATTRASSKKSSTTAKRKPSAKAKSKRPAKKKAAKARKHDSGSSEDEFQPPSDGSSDDDDDDELDFEAEKSDEEIPEDRGEGEDDAEAPKSGLSIKIDTSSYRPIRQIKDLSYDEVEQMYGPRLRIIADADVQKEQLYAGLPPGKPIPDNQAIILGVILRTRAKGFTQAALTKDLGLDARSSGHYVKSLAQRGAIVRKPVSVGFRTNLCIHARYATEENQKHNAEAMGSGNRLGYNVNAVGVAYSNKKLQSAVAELLAGAPDHIMFTDDILTGMAFNPKEKLVKKWFFRCLDEPCSRNIFRKLRPTSNRSSRLIQLVDLSYVHKGSLLGTGSVANIDDDLKQKGCAGLRLEIKGLDRRPAGGLLYDMMLEPQLLDALYAFGTTGATQKDLGYALGYSDARALYKGMEKLTSLPKSAASTRFTVQKAMEFEGRIKRYRYYTLQSFMQATQNQTIEVTGPPAYSFKENELAEINYRVARKAEAMVPKKRGRAKKVSQAIEARDSSSSPEPSETPAPKRGRSGLRKEPSHADSSRSNTAHDDEAAGSSSSSVPAVRETRASAPRNVASIFLPKKRTRSQAAAEAAATAQDGESNDNPSGSESAIVPDEASVPKEHRSRTRKSTAVEDAGGAVPATKRPRGRPRKNAHAAEAERPPEPEPTREPSTTDTQRMSPAPEARMDVDQSDQLAPSPSPSQSDTPRRRNLFDYFSPRSAMGRTRDSAAVPVPSSGVQARSRPGETFQKRMSEIQVGASLATRTEAPQPSEAADADATMGEPEPSVSVDDTVSTTTTHEAPTAIASAESPQVSTPATPLSTIAESSYTRFTTRHSDQVFRTKDGIVSAKHKRDSSNTNAYAMTRKAIMLELLNEKGILDRSADLKALLLERYEEKYGDVKIARNIDLKTVWRSAESLEAEGKGYITSIEITRLTGKPQSRLVLVRNDIDKDGPEMQAFTKEQNHKKVQISYRGKMAKFEKFEKNVERLEDRIVRMQDAQSTFAGDASPEARRIRGDLKVLRENVAKAAKFTREVDTATTSGNWLMIAIQYGFITSKMMRVKLVHQYLFGLLQSGGDGIDHESRTIRPTTIIQRMPLGLCLQTVGYYMTSSELSDYIENPANLEHTLAELPERLRVMIISEKNRYRRRLRSMLDHLVVLRAIDPVDENGNPATAHSLTSGNFAPCYRICAQVPIIDFWSPGSNVIKEYPIDMPSDLMLYWSDLQYFCTSAGETRTAIPESIPQTDLPVIRALNSPKNWSMHYVFAREQREYLNSFVDKKSGQTPYSNTQRCKEIARSLKISMQMVINYYRKMEAAFKRKFDKKTVRALEGTIAGRRRKNRRVKTEDGTRAHKSISLSTRRVFRKNYGGYSTAQRLLGGQRHGMASDDSKQDTYLDEESIPLVDDLSTNSFKRRRIRRVRWTEQEDELLLYCYIILKTRAQMLETRFQWRSALEVLPTRNIDQCRHRIAKLKAIPKVAEHIGHLTTLWSLFYKRGLDTHAIEDSDPLNPAVFNILPYLEYFIQQIHDHGSSNVNATVTLPSSRQELESVYDIFVSVGESQSSLKQVEDIYHRTESLIQKEKTLARRWTTVRAPWDHLRDTLPKRLDLELMKYERDVEFLMIVNRMILFTPNETYDPFFAYGIMMLSPEDVRFKATEIMRSKEQLVMSKGARIISRRLPGSVLGISDRYLSRMACTLPDNFYRQATVFQKYLKMQGTARYMPRLVSSGMMGCILNMISSGKLKLELLFEDILNLKSKIPLYRSRLLDEKITNLSVQLRLLEDNKRELEEESKADSHDVPSPQKLTPAELSSHWSGLLCSQAPKTQPSLKIVMAHLDSVKENGATLVDIKENVLLSRPETTDREIHQSMNILCNSLPPLVVKVGFQSYRYVQASYLEHWMIVVKEVPTVAVESDEIAARSQELATARKEVIQPRLWHDLNGCTTPAILQGVIDSIVQHVLERPGIMERDILRLFEKLLVYAEVKDVLDLLVQRGALCRRTIVHTPVKFGLFSKRRVYTANANPHLIERTSQTCYWTTPEYYERTTIDSQ